VALISVVKLIKLEEGPLVKRLLKSNLIQNIYLSSIRYFRVILTFFILVLKTRLRIYF
jgi:hypothetical protein